MANKLVAPTPEEEKAFNEELQALAKKHSFALSIVPQFKPNEKTKAYEVVGILLIQKVVEDGVVSDNPEVNPKIIDVDIKED